MSRKTAPMKPSSWQCLLFLVFPAAARPGARIKVARRAARDRVVNARRRRDPGMNMRFNFLNFVEN